jgi:hypothetical protein
VSDDASPVPTIPCGYGCAAGVRPVVFTNSKNGIVITCFVFMLPILWNVMLMFRHRNDVKALGEIVAICLESFLPLFFTLIEMSEIACSRKGDNNAVQFVVLFTCASVPIHLYTKAKCKLLVAESKIATVFEIEHDSGLMKANQISFKSRSGIRKLVRQLEDVAGKILKVLPPAFAGGESEEGVGVYEDGGGSAAASDDDTDESDGDDSTNEDDEDVRPLLPLRGLGRPALLARMHAARVRLLEATVRMQETLYHCENYAAMLEPLATLSRLFQGVILLLLFNSAVQEKSRRGTAALFLFFGLELLIPILVSYTMTFNPSRSLQRTRELEEWYVALLFCDGYFTFVAIGTIWCFVCSRHLQE